MYLYQCLIDWLIDFQIYLFKYFFICLLMMWAVLTFFQNTVGQVDRTDLGSITLALPGSKEVLAGVLDLGFICLCLFMYTKNIFMHKIYLLIKCCFFLHKNVKRFI